MDIRKDIGSGDSWNYATNNYGEAKPEYSYYLEIVQQPVHARAMGWGTKCDSRRPVDPPPVIYFTITDKHGHVVTDEVPSNFIIHTSLYEVLPTGPNGQLERSLESKRLTGTTIGSLSHIRKPAPGRFYFILHDISIRQEGRYYLEFNVWEVVSENGILTHRGQVLSNLISVFSPKMFPGLETSSALIKDIANQGCKVRVRKESTVRRRRSRRDLSRVSKSVHKTKMLYNMKTPIDYPSMESAQSLSMGYPTGIGQYNGYIPTTTSYYLPSSTGTTAPLGRPSWVESSEGEEGYINGVNLSNGIRSVSGSSSGIISVTAGCGGGGGGGSSVVGIPGHSSQGSSSGPVHGPVQGPSQALAPVQRTLHAPGPSSYSQVLPLLTKNDSTINSRDNSASTSTSNGSMLPRPPDIALNAIKRDSVGSYQQSMSSQYTNNMGRFNSRKGVMQLTPKLQYPPNQNQSYQYPYQYQYPYPSQQSQINSSTSGNFQQEFGPFNPEFSFEPGIFAPPTTTATTTSLSVPQQTYPAICSPRDVSGYCITNDTPSLF